MFSSTTTITHTELIKPLEELGVVIDVDYLGEN